MKRSFPATEAWLALLARFGTERPLKSAPRGQPTLELLHQTIQVNLRQPLVLAPRRALSYRGACAEAYWILSGDDTVAGIAPWLKRMSEFSDNGETLFGAYGPPIQRQLPYVVAKLTEDQDSRQAVLTLWRESPPATKDVPCTSVMTFMIRGGLLHQHVFMRSSDAWLGVPYDLFSFAMVAHQVCCRLNQRGEPLVLPGTLYLTMASSHLYERDQEGADFVLGDTYAQAPQPVTPAALCTTEALLLDTLKQLRDTAPGDCLRWWEWHDTVGPA